MKVTRRDMLKLACGSAVGLLCTPVPWKLLDDSAIWTQNWPLVPRLPRGPITFRFSTCTLCPGGCALKARCVSGMPVSLTGVAGHPVSHGVLCPIGLTGHHLAYHPLRLRRPMQFVGSGDDGVLAPVSYEDVLARMAAALGSRSETETVAVLDQRPGRAISDYYQEFLEAVPNGLYLNPPSRECSTAARLQELLGMEAPLGMDFENARCVLSFGAPLLDGWGTPGRMFHVFNRRQETGLKLIQVESVQSRTALQADRWLPIRPGTEGVLAMGIANVIISEKLHPAEIAKNAVDFAEYREVVSAFPPEVVAGVTGLSAADIVATARQLVENGPAIVIAGCDPGAGPLGPIPETAIAGLNLLAGSLNHPGGFIVRRTLPGSRAAAAHVLADVPDHSIRLLLLDGAECGYTFPWSLVQRKLVREAPLVVSLSPYMTGFAAHADCFLPSPAHLESLQDTLNATDARTSSYSLASPLHDPVDGPREPAECITQLALAAGIWKDRKESAADLLRRRVQAIYDSKRGSVFCPPEGPLKAVSDFADADELWKALGDAAVWIDDDVVQGAPERFHLLGRLVDAQKTRIDTTPPHSGALLVLMPAGWRAALGNGTLPPLMSKLYQESGLRSLAGYASINPATGAEQNINDGDRATIRTGSGTTEAVIQHDPSVMPGIVLVAAGPRPNGTTHPAGRGDDGVLEVCDVQADATWRMSPASVQRV